MYIMIYVCVYLLIFHIYITSVVVYVTSLISLEKIFINIKIILNRENLPDYRQDTLLHFHIYLFNRLNAIILRCGLNEDSKS